MSADSPLPPGFDLFVHEYDALLRESIKASGYSTLYFAEYKIKEVANYLAGINKANKAVNFLNFGCGIGNSEGYIRQYLPNSAIYSVDVSTKSIEYASDRHKNLENAHFSVMDGSNIPFDISFDAIFAANVLHHIPRAQHLHILQMLNQALKPLGHLFIFEHNPMNPATVRVVKKCPFDAGVVLLSPLYTCRILRQARFDRRTLRFTLFFPKALSFLNPVEKYLKKVPIGAQYYFIARKKTWS